MKKKFSNKAVKIIILLIINISLVSCGAKKAKHPDDPAEPINRAIFSLNKGLDALYIKPVLYTYRMIVPPPIRTGVGNVIGNVAEIPTIANSVLQNKLDVAGKSIVRFMVNSTLGIFGIFDIASEFGIPRYSETLSNTLMAWGYQHSSYIVLPILGPATVRDIIGFYGNTYMSIPRYTDVKTRNRYYIADYIHTRSELLELDEVVRSVSAVDEYAFIRDAYFQRRARISGDKSVIEEDNKEFLDEPPE